MRVTKTYDDLLILKDAGLLAASAACQVDGAAKIIDIGAGDLEGDIVIDATAVEVDSGNEVYNIGAQVSDDAAFASGIYEVCSIRLGDSVPLHGDADMGVGRYILPFQNRIADGVAKRYLRLYVTIAGTIGTGINFSAYLSKKSA